MIDKFYVDLGNWLESQRKSRKLSQTEIARRMGVTKVAVHCWEKGKRKMYAATLLMYCRVAGIDLNDFLEERKNARL